MVGEKVRFGLVGFGAWGQLHAQTIAGHPEAELAAVAALSEASRAAAAECYPGVPVYSSHLAMIEEARVDMVDVVTPSHTHVEITCAALAAGCHVLLEKPMALTLPDCRKMLDLAAEKGRILAIGHELRLSSQWGEIKHLIDLGMIGEPQYMLVELSRKPYRQGAGGWRYDERRVGSWVLEEPIHFFDLARWYLSGHGEPSTVYAVANSRDPARPGLHDNFSSVMRYESGAYAVISQTLAAFEHHQTVKVAGRRGAIWASWSGALDRTLEPVCSLRLFNGETVQDIPLERRSGEVFELGEEIDMCIRCVREGLKPVAGPLDGLWSTGLCLAAEESVRRSVPVSLREFIEGNADLGGAVSGRFP